MVKWGILNCSQFSSGHLSLVTYRTLSPYWVALSHQQRGTVNTTRGPCGLLCSHSYVEESCPCPACSFFSKLYKTIKPRMTPKNPWDPVWGVDCRSTDVSLRGLIWVCLHHPYVQFPCGATCADLRLTLLVGCGLRAYSLPISPPRHLSCSCQNHLLTSPQSWAIQWGKLLGNIAWFCPRAFCPIAQDLGIKMPSVMWSEKQRSD